MGFFYGLNVCFIISEKSDNSLEFIACVYLSANGIQYCSAYYRAIHQKHQITCSMTDGYDCYQNALAERVNGILKHEFLLNKPWHLAEARKMLTQSISIYNTQRPHLNLKCKTPEHVYHWHAHMLAHGTHIAQATKTHRDDAPSLYCHHPAGNLAQFICHAPISAGKALTR